MTAMKTNGNAVTRVELAFNALKLLGLTCEERGLVFGRKETKDNRHLNGLKQELVKSCSIDASDRLDWLVDIGTGVAVLCGSDHDKMKAWMEVKHKDLENMLREGLTPKQLLLTGHLHHVAKLHAYVGGLVGAK